MAGPINFLLKQLGLVDSNFLRNLAVIKGTLSPFAIITSNFRPYFEYRNCRAMSQVMASPLAQYGGRFTVTMIPGDGIGPEMMGYVKEIFRYTGAPVDFEEVELDFKHTEQSDFKNALIAIKRNGVALKGSIESKYGEHMDIISRNAALRTELDLFVNVLHCKSYPGVRSRYKDIDIVIIRQNTEGEYSMLEHENVKGVVESLKIITRQASERVARYTFEWAKKNNRHMVTCVHKANIMKLGDGLFLDCCNEIAKEYPEIEYNSMIVDNTCMQLVAKPHQFDVMVTPNLYGTVISNIVCGLVGGAGLISGRNYGNKYAVFEPGTRNTGSNMVGKNVANPIAMLNASCDLLEHLELYHYSELIRNAVDKVMNEDKIHTPDLGGHSTNIDVIQSILKVLQSSMDHWKGWLCLGPPCQEFAENEMAKVVTFGCSINYSPAYLDFGSGTFPSLSEIFEGTFAEGQEKDINVTGGGHLVIGQDVDLNETSFQRDQEFCGEMSQLNFFPVALELDDMKTFVRNSGQTNFPPTLLDFKDKFHLLTRRGDLIVRNASTNEFETKNATEILIPNRITFKEAKEVCHILRGEIISPETRNEFNQIYATFSTFEEACIGSQNTMYWIGFVANIKREWQTVSEKVLSEEQLSLFEEGNRDPRLYQCVSGGGENGKNLLEIDCASKICTVCKLQGTPHFKLKGMCADSLIDINWIWDGYISSSLVFYGDTYGSLIWNGSLVMMKNNRYPINGETLPNQGLNLPLGRRFWNITGDACQNDELLFTICNDSELTCSDSGQCFHKNKRCDTIADCQDKSDEENCGIIINKENNDKPPYSYQLTVMFSINITSISQFDLNNFTLKIVCIWFLTWRDQRLLFRNLKMTSNLNYIADRSQLWLPNLAAKDNNNGPADVVIKADVLRVMRESSPIPADYSVSSDDEIFSGQNNSLQHIEVATIEFTCAFDLQYYPFDFQICSLAFSVGNAGNYRLEKVTLTFQNQYGYYLGNTVLPNLLLLIISYSVFYYDLTDFQDRIMVSLTSLLVLTSNFAQTSQSIPKTAYLKLIDLWFVFMIVYEFLIILSVVVVEYLRLRKDQNHHQHEMDRKRILAWEIHLDTKKAIDKSLDEMWNFRFRIIFPVILMIILSAFAYISVKNAQIN